MLSSSCARTSFSLLSLRSLTMPGDSNARRRASRFLLVPERGTHEYLAVLVVASRACPNPSSSSCWNEPLPRADRKARSFILPRSPASRPRPTSPHHFAERGHRFETVVLRRALTRSTELYDWRRRILDGNEERRDVTIRPSSRAPGGRIQLVAAGQGLAAPLVRPGLRCAREQTSPSRSSSSPSTISSGRPDLRGNQPAGFVTYHYTRRLRWPSSADPSLRTVQLPRRYRDGRNRRTPGRLPGMRPRRA